MRWKQWNVEFASDGRACTNEKKEKKKERREDETQISNTRKQNTDGGQKGNISERFSRCFLFDLLFPSARSHTSAAGRSSFDGLRAALEPLERPFRVINPISRRFLARSTAVAWHRSDSNLALSTSFTLMTRTWKRVFT